MGQARWGLLLALAPLSRRSAWEEEEGRSCCSSAAVLFALRPARGAGHPAGPWSAKAGSRHPERLIAGEIVVVGPESQVPTATRPLAFLLAVAALPFMTLGVKLDVDGVALLGLG